MQRRTVLRRLVDEAVKKVEQAMQAVDSTEARIQFEVLVGKVERLESVNNELINKFADGATSSTMTPEEVDNEFLSIENDHSKFLVIRKQFELFLEAQRPTIPAHQDVSVATGNDSRERRNIMLPKISLRKFDGEIKNWLGFWSQFSEIHEDRSISPTTKFLYLRDAMVPGSPAAELVDSYVPSERSYPVVIEQLRSRFARDGLLIETYMRELLSLVMLNQNGQTLELRALFDRLETQLRALDSLGLSSNKYAAMLKPLVESALPEDVLMAWERSRIHYIRATENQENREGDELEALLRFLRAEVEGSQRVQLAKATFGNLAGKGPHTASALHSSSFEKKETKKRDGPSSATYARYREGSKKYETKEGCVWCGFAHVSSECCKARSWSLRERMDYLKRKGACYVCLQPGPGHIAAECKAIVKCMICLGRHHTIICDKFTGVEKQKAKVAAQTNLTETSDGDGENQHVPAAQANVAGGIIHAQQSTAWDAEEAAAVLLSHQAGPTLLQTLLVTVVAPRSGKVVRALLDSGSQRSYVTKALARELDLERVGDENLSHSLFGGTETRAKTHRKYKLVVQGLDLPSRFSFSALDEDKICNYVPRLIDTQIIQRLERAHIVLSDAGPNPPPVDILFGADVIGSILTGLTMNLDGHLVATETILGWTIMGPTYRNKAESQVIGLANLTFDLQDLWKLETLGISDGKEQEREKARRDESTALLKVHVNQEGRYEVALPWKGRTPGLVCNRLAAEKRLMSTTRSLMQSSKFSDYDKVFKEWLELDIIERVPENEDIHDGFYLPHRAVIKESSQTTKIRPVFDASAKDYNGLSLNSGLEKGPNLIEDILKLLLQFRRGSIGVTADIAKAFLQISIVPEHRKYLKFLWWAAEDRKRMIEYRHKRVVFGVTSSPFLLNATIEYHLANAPEEFKDIAQKLQGTFYMDNVVTSVEDRHELKHFVSQSRALMELAKFDLRQWASGPQLLEPVQTPGKPISILGVHWDQEGDLLYVDRNPTTSLDQITRRTLLSMVHAYFDPLGLIAPYTLLPRRVLQDAWSTKGDWDDRLIPALQDKVFAWTQGAELIPMCKMERRLTMEKWSSAQVSLHVFCDASQFAYATCIFIREVQGNTVRVSLVQAKTRVAPRKPNLSIPRLELMAALIGVRLWDGICKALGPSCITTYFWSDSRVALNWIKGEKEWSVFVGNRCAEIRKISRPDQWFHVPGVFNPADLPSRGCTAKVLLESRWWEGPSWLKDKEKDWPQGKVEPEEAERAEILKEVLRSKANILVKVSEVKNCGLPSLSKFRRIVTTVARLMRWKTHRKGERSSDFTSDELASAENRVFRVVQRAHFGGGAKFTKELETFFDSEGLLRLRTRLAFSEESEEFKNPILLPGGSSIVQAYAREQHFALHHAGVGTMMVALRERFWITDIRRVLKRIIGGCKQCKRHSSKPLETPFAPLPRDRVRQSAVFEVTGVDYAGPLYLKGGSKAWIVLFTCAVYRAVHLEVVTSLSTECFLEALDRFIARRGRPSVIYSDNGTQFVGASNSLKAINWSAVVVNSSVTGIKWNFIPPAAPWWGGFWERMVGMVKQLLRRNLGRATLSYENLNTVLCDVEATVNMRPLTYRAEDETKPLTPACFMMGIPAAGVKDLDEVVRRSYHSRLKYLLRVREGLRERFRTEYQALLINRGRRKPTAVQPGDVVLVGSDGAKRLDWPLGRVLELGVGADGHSRVARLRMDGKREVWRPLGRLYPLEVAAESDLWPGQEQEEPVQDEEGPSRDQPELTGLREAVEGTTRSGRKVKRPKRFQP